MSVAEKLKLGATTFVFALAICSGLMRLYYRAFAIRRLDVDDHLILAAMSMVIAVLPVNYLMVDAIRVVSQAVENRQLDSTGMGLMKRVYKEIFACSILYLLQLGLVKLSLLAFYRRFLPRRPYHYILYAVAACIICCTIGFSLATWVFRCERVSDAWNLPLDDRACDDNQLVIHLAASIFHLLVDVFVLFLPLPIILRLHVSSKKKVGLAAIFLVGVVGTAATCARIWQITTRMKEPFGAQFSSGIADSFLFSQVEANLAMLCANAPGLAGLWKHLRAGGERKGPRASRRSGPFGQHHELGFRLETRTAPTQSTQAGVQRSSEDGVMDRPRRVHQIARRNSEKELA